MRTAVVIMCVATALTSAAAAATGPREIHLNGERLNPFGVALLDVVNCGQAVPDGRYVIDWTRRNWGYEGSAARAPLPECTTARVADRAAGRGGAARSWEDRTHEGLCLRGGHCGIDIVINPVYR